MVAKKEPEQTNEENTNMNAQLTPNNAVEIDGEKQTKNLDSDSDSSQGSEQESSGEEQDTKHKIKQFDPVKKK